MIHEDYMQLAFEEARKAKDRGDWPFGAVIVKDGIVVGKGYVKDKSGGDVTDHAELVAVRDTCRNLKTNDLQGCTIYCSNEPCIMCAAGIFQSNIGRVFIGVSGEDLPKLLRPRKLRIEDIAKDSGHKIEITRGLLKEKIPKIIVRFSFLSLHYFFNEFQINDPPIRINAIGRTSLKSNDGIMRSAKKTNPTTIRTIPTTILPEPCFFGRDCVPSKFIESVCADCPFAAV